MAHEIKARAKTQSLHTKFSSPAAGAFLLGIGFTFLIALAAKWLSGLPGLAIVGQLVLAILIGIGCRAAIGTPSRAMQGGIAFSGKKLLRVGIILLGMRLDLLDIAHSGGRVVLLAAAAIGVGFGAVYAMCRLLRIDKTLGVLTACGTAICGAAAIVAIAPQVKARDDETAMSVAVIAILGTLFTLAYTVLFPWLGLDGQGYGLFAGATLHELAHVIAAAAPGGSEAVDSAVIVKLTRVAMLVPVALLIGVWHARREREPQHDGTAKSAASRNTVPIPWFIFGFLAMSAIHSLGIVPPVWIDRIVLAAYMLLGMAMAGLGLTIEASAFRRFGVKPIVAGFTGSVVLSAVGYGLIRLLQLA